MNSNFKLVEIFLLFPGTYKENCDEGEFDCDDATCISMKLRCNGRYNCRFRWDEDDCQVKICFIVCLFPYMRAVF